MKRLHRIPAALLLVVATSPVAMAKAGPAAGAAGSSSPLLASVDVVLDTGQALDVGAEVAAVASVELALQAPRSWTYLADLARFSEDAKWRLEMDVQGLSGGCVEPSVRLKTRVRGYQLFRGVNTAVKKSLIPYAARDCEPLRTPQHVGGVFLTTDPLGYVDGPNLYQYALNNPINYSDPMGLCANSSWVCRMWFRFGGTNSQQRAARDVYVDVVSRTARAQAHLDASGAETYEAAERQLIDFFHSYKEGFSRSEAAALAQYALGRSPSQGVLPVLEAFPPETALWGQFFEGTLIHYPDVIGGTQAFLYGRAAWRAFRMRGLATVGDDVARALPNAPSGVTILDPTTIRFSQSNVRRTLPEITQSMKARGWQGSPIDVVRMPDGTLITVDNTRLAAASLTNTPVHAVVREFSEIFPAARAGGNLQGATWGEAVLNRIAGQKRAWRQLYPQGSPFTGIHPSTPGFSP
ncbi:MAG: hypothetical protein MPN21_27670 [Thermoanaerobaculia bacterium]|nr:hypothetical protein [Thermoanaerobaculia bacterium]